MNFEIIVIVVTVLTFILTVISVISGLIYQKRRTEFERRKLERQRLIDVLIEEYKKLKGGKIVLS